jgi:hypothetical protein
MSQFTARVAARTAVAKLILDKHMPAASKVGLTQSDLEAIVTQGLLAAKADAEQQEQLAAAQVRRSGQKDKKDDLFLREDGLRNRLPAVIADLASSTDPHARALAPWLDRLSFARYRFRVLDSEPSDSPTSADEEEVQRVKRVEREDVSSRASALASFCRALTKPGREAIVAALETRGLSRPEIDSMAVDSDAVADAGRNVMQAAEATQREAAAVSAQKAKWTLVRRMIRTLAKADPELRSRLSDC